jgi:YD repeat-containing protein
VYDAASRTVATVNPLAKRTSTTYDAAGRSRGTFGDILNCAKPFPDAEAIPPDRRSPLDPRPLPPIPIGWRRGSRGEKKLDSRVLSFFWPSANSWHGGKGVHAAYAVCVYYSCPDFFARCANFVGDANYCFGGGSAAVGKTRRRRAINFPKLLTARSGVGWHPSGGMAGRDQAGDTISHGPYGSGQFLGLGFSGRIQQCFP